MSLWIRDGFISDRQVLERKLVEKWSGFCKNYGVGGKRGGSLLKTW